MTQQGAASFYQLLHVEKLARYLHKFKDDKRLYHKKAHKKNFTWV